MSRQHGGERAGQAGIGMTIEDASGPEHPDEGDEFLLREGLDLLAAFRAIRNAEIRRAFVVSIAAVAQAERDAEAGRSASENWGHVTDGR